MEREICTKCKRPVISASTTIDGVCIVCRNNERIRLRVYEPIDRSDDPHDQDYREEEYQEQHWRDGRY